MKEFELVNLLITKHLKISAAESCTGGMFISKIINVPDASKVVEASFVTYSSEMKTKLVGVNPSTIEKNNVVSLEVAGEMAEGVCKVTGADIGVGITGLAGPSGGTEEIPVGTVCFGFCVKGKTYTFKKQFYEKRNTVRRRAVTFAFSKLIEILKSAINAKELWF